MKRILLVAITIATVAASSSADKAERFVDEFARTCMAANGDFEAMKSAVKAAGFKHKPHLNSRPSSLYAKRGSHIIVYRGAPEGRLVWPNCSIQTDYSPGGNFERLGLIVERRFGLGTATRSANCGARPVLKWSAQHNGQNMAVSLVDDLLVGDRNLRLGIMPWSDKRLDCSTFKPKIIERGE